MLGEHLDSLLIILSIEKHVPTLGGKEDSVRVCQITIDFTIEK